MAQRDKVKELVGRGLHSYHTKALQQVDRIEKKNKEQNHKISILSNELDNDYLTKTEEGSVISLEHSKEGMVYLDELQGNTLVNYCTDGSKELTLNGDIDVEGTFVTTTEGVDGGLVDVMCEGNTLVNLVGKMRNKTQAYYTIDENYITILDSETDHRQSYYTLSDGQLNLIKPNTTYTIIAEITKNTLQSNFTLINNYQGNKGDITSDGVSVPIGFVGRYVGKFTTLSDFTNRSRLGFSAGSGNRGEITLRNNFIILEGDWTNRDIPASYFKGMKSVGQDDENGHKIEILSQNKNLLTSDKFEKWGNEINIEYSGDVEKFVECSKTSIEVEPNTTYTFSALMKATSNLKSAEIYLYEYKKGETKYFKATPKYVVTDNILEFTRVSYTFTTSKETDKILLRFDNNGSSDGNVAILTCKEYCLSLGNNTTYVEPMFNKKEILMNEPLRSLPDGTKDKIVKINGKWFIERNTIYCDSTVDNFNIATETQSVWGGETTTAFRFDGYNFKSKGDNSLVSVISDSVVCVSANDGQGFSKTENEYLCLHSNGFIIGAIKTSKITSTLTEYFRANSLKFITKRNTPIYEPLEVEPTLNTYTDITHISNNSIIPCNMKIKNSGYNAIIKPSTLYTVALDTNKSGTIGLNLGGAKGTTTNNVLKLTTPATLADDSLRLYGKGIKGSKVRLLEGDKTNWIPSHFEGMKSSFEDKLQDDGSYKMEILSNDISLFDLHNRNFYIDKNQGASNLTVNGRKIEYDANGNYRYLRYDRFNFVRGKKYTIVIKGNNSRVLYYNNNNLSATGITSNNTKYVTFVASHNAYTTGIENGERGACKVTIEDVWIYEGEYDESKHTTTKSNKIQFSSIEPLRSVKNIKDKFVFKDGKLMIERNCIERDLTRTLPWSLNKTIASSNGVQFVCRPFSGWGNCKPKETEIICSKKPTLQNDGGNHSIWVYDKSTIVLQMNNGLIKSVNDLSDWLDEEKPIVVVPLVEPIYEEIPFELQKIILEGYENGTLFIDTNIPPTSTVTYAGETPIVKSVKLNKTEVLNNTNDINDNIIPYLMDMDYRVVCLQLQSEGFNAGVAMARLFGGAYEMLKRDIQSKRYSVDEYRYRLDAYLSANKITEEEYNKLGDMLNE